MTLSSIDSEHFLGEYKKPVFLPIFQINIFGNIPDFKFLMIIFKAKFYT